MNFIKNLLGALKKCHQHLRNDGNYHLFFAAHAASSRGGGLTPPRTCRTILGGGLTPPRTCRTIPRGGVRVDSDVPPPLGATSARSWWSWSTLRSSITYGNPRRSTKEERTERNNDCKPNGDTAPRASQSASRGHHHTHRALRLASDSGVRPRCECEGYSTSRRDENDLSLHYSWC